VLSLFAALTLMGACIKQEPKDPHLFHTPVSTSEDGELVAVQDEGTLEAHGMHEVPLSDDRKDLCTSFVFNFLGHLVLNQRLSFGDKTPEQVASFMLNEGAIPIFYPDYRNPSRLRIHRFNKCSRIKDPIRAILHEAQRRATLTSDSFWNIQPSQKSLKKRRPTDDEWATLNKQIKTLRANSFPDKVTIRKRRLRQYLGKRNEGDEIIAVLTGAQTLPLSTILRLQGRIIDFIGLSESGEILDEMDADYAVDSVTDQEFEILARSGLHLTTDDLEKKLYGKLVSPFLDAEFDAERLNLIKEVEEAAISTLDKVQSRIIGRRVLGLPELAPTTHEGIILDQLADLNPDSKFLVFSENLGNGRREDIESPDSKGLMTGSLESRQRRVKFFKNSLAELTKALVARGTFAVVHSAGPGGFDMLPDEIFPNLQSILNTDFESLLAYSGKSRPMMPKEWIYHLDS
jgi:hypothetical protein